jgi:putative transposase
MNEMLTRTICIKLDVDGNEAALTETQQQFNAAASWIATVCWDQHITNTNTAHHRVYGQTRARFRLGAQLAVCARAKAMEAIKAVKTQNAERLTRWRTDVQRRRAAGRSVPPPPEAGNCPQFGRRGSIRYDARTYRLLALDRVSLNTLRGRITSRLILGKRQHEMLIDPAWEIGGAELVWRRGIYYLHVTQHREAPALSSPQGGEAIGIDLGIVHVATDSTGERFTGAHVRKARSRYVARRAALQHVGTKSAKRRLKQMSGRERRYMNDVNHRIAKTLVHKAVVSRKALALEDLTGLKEAETSGTSFPRVLRIA